MQTTEQNTSLRLWTVAEYHQMVETGILAPDEPVELVAGQVIKMSPQKSLHATAITLTRLLLEDSLGKQVLVRSQLPVTLSDRSEPEPDVAVVMADVLRYLDHHPTPSEIYLIIEIADTTVKTDCNLKAKVYAHSGVKDYWVLDLNQRQLHVFREPSQSGYQRRDLLEEADRISPLEFPELSIQVRDLLPPLPC